MKPDRIRTDEDSQGTWSAEPSSLKKFPRPRPLPPFTEELRASGIELLPANAADNPWLCALYRTSRLAELRVAPWSADQKRAFLGDQFALQYSHFLKMSPKGDYRLIHRDKAPIGRIHFDRSGRDWLLIDILLAADSRNNGICSALIRSLQQSAMAAGAERLRLQVAHNNPRARRLYECLGFLESPASESHFPATHSALRWNRNRAPLGRVTFFQTMGEDDEIGTSANA